MTYEEGLFRRQGEYFRSGRTLSARDRIESLESIRSAMYRHRGPLEQAAFEDLRKSPFQVHGTELSSVESEIRELRRNLPKWIRPRRVRTNLLNLPGSSRQILEPLGQSLIIGTWNYPYLINLLPAVTSIAAGNTVVIKPSEYAPASAHALADLLSDAVPPELCTVVKGGVEEVQELLRHPFNKIFFTGSTRIGKLIMQAAAGNLASVTLELGGKSPALVLRDANIGLAARRIVLGKFLNSGQSCIAPDFVLVHESRAEELVDRMAREIVGMYGLDPSASESYGRIIDHRHFDRLAGMIDPTRVVTGGSMNRQDLYISPTILYPVDFSDAVMEEEIFGPLLPVITYRQLDEAIARLKEMPKPLALYVFTSSRPEGLRLASTLSFGGACVNDTLMHIKNQHLPFGGVGPSGFGRYHGIAGVLEFSNRKSVLIKPPLFDPRFRYPPYDRWKQAILRKLL